MRVLAMGDTGLLVETDDVLVLDRALRHSGTRPLAVLDVVPAARTVLVVVEAGAALDPVRRWVEAVAGSPTEPPRPGPQGGDEPTPDGTDDPAVVNDVGIDVVVDVVVDVVLDVVYDGPDLDEVGRLTGLGVDGVVAAHTSSLWTVAFTGFAPGFGYLVGGDVRLRVPRLEVPRTRVPAGAVALAGPYSGVYPRESPGGWRLIGRADAHLWDVDRDPPALLRPGAVVQFVARTR